MVQTTFTVADYLIQRLLELGVRHLFSIPGDYIVPFLQRVDDNGEITRIGNTNEMEAGYAADAYGRVHGVGAVAVTCGVGALSLVNTVAGAYVERVPMVVINGTPGTDKRRLDRDTGLMWHHMMVDGESRDLQVYRNYTAAAVEVDNAARAPLDIDQALSACLTEQAPVYLEMFEDIYAEPCEPPSQPLPHQPVASVAANLQAAVVAAAARIIKARNPVIWGGLEVQRDGVQDAFEALVAQTRIPFTTTLAGKAIVAETNPLFAGVYDGLSSNAAAGALMADCDCVLALGAWPTDVNLLGVVAQVDGGVRPWGDDQISALRGSVRVGTSYFAQVNLGDFLAGLTQALKPYRNAAVFTPLPTAVATAGAAKPGTPGTHGAALNFDNFFERMGRYVDETHIVVCDIGFSALGAMNLQIKQRSGFVSQAVWAAIGYAAPAAIGVKCGQPRKRPLVFAGDGAFHMTLQAFGTMAKLEHNAVVFVMNNGIYGVEQWLVNAAAFAPPAKPAAVTPINTLARWEFSKLPEVFGGGKGYKVSTLAELDEALQQIAKAPEQLTIVDVRLPEMSLPGNAQWKVAATPTRPAR